jgi:branched-chain amino acid aminotransferase
VFAQPDGSLASFRPERNAARLNRSARRLGIPDLPEDLFMAAVRELVAADGAWVPTNSDSSLYVRPFIFATEVGLGLHASASYTFCVIASPSGPYFPGGVEPVSVWWSTDYVRAAPGGTGAAKFGGNYAASLAAQAVAVENGCDQVVWLDSAEHRWVEEMGGMNLFFVFGSGADVEVVTPELSGSLLPGITRDSLLVLSRDLGYRAVERRVSITEWADRNESGELTEVFACGTAAVITPVGTVVHDHGKFDINGGKPGPVTLQLRQELTELQYGNKPDPHHWMTRVGRRTGAEGVQN